MLAAGCSDFLGFERSDLLVTCIHNSDCADGLYCFESTCGPQCANNKDCVGPPAYPSGLICRSGYCVEADAGVGVASDDGGCGETTTDVNNCGWCGNACAGSNVNWKCVASKCTMDACLDGWKDCDGNPSNGCETDIADDANSCGDCPDADASVCQSGVCQNESCDVADVIGGTCSANTNPELQPRSFNPGQLAGAAFSASSVSRVTAIGINTPFQNVTQHAYLAIYTDSGSGPMNRVGPAYPVTMTGGTVETPVEHTAASHTDLAPNTPYWLMAVSDNYLVFDACMGDAQWAEGPAIATFAEPPATLPTSTLPITLLQLPNIIPSIYIKVAHPQ
jgi:hypothetical protein